MPSRSAMISVSCWESVSWLLRLPPLLTKRSPAGSPPRSVRISRRYHRIGSAEFRREVEGEVALFSLGIVLLDVDDQLAPQCPAAP